MMKLPSLPTFPTLLSFPAWSYLCSFALCVLAKLAICKKSAKRVANVNFF